MLFVSLRRLMFEQCRFHSQVLHYTVQILLYCQLTHNTTCLNTVLVYLTCQMCKMCQFHSQLFHIEEIWVCIQIIQSEWVTQLQLSERGYCCIHIWTQYTNYLTEGMKQDNQNKSQKYTITHETAVCPNPPTHNFKEERKTWPILHRLTNT